MGVSGLFQAPSPAVSPFLHHRCPSSYLPLTSNLGRRRDGNSRISGLVLVNKQDSQPSPSASISTQGDAPDAQDLEYVSQIKRVLELLRKNRDMLFNEVKLTVMIEDPRDVERKRLLGIDDENTPTRDDLADALVQVNEGKIPEDRVALRMLAEEMLQWPNLEVEATKKKQPGKSLYAKFTDTGINPLEAAKRLNIDWDSAAEIEDAASDDVEVPPAVGYGALYLITAFPVIIGTAAERHLRAMFIPVFVTLHMGILWIWPSQKWHHKVFSESSLDLVSYYSLYLYQNSGPFSIREVDEALKPGLYALIDSCSADDLQLLHSLFGEGPCRSTLATLQHDYKINFQFGGKV